MKKIILFALTVVTILTMNGCGSTENIEQLSTNTSSIAEKQESVSEETVESKEEQAEIEEECSSEEACETHVCDVCGGSGTIHVDNTCPTCLGTGMENVWVNVCDGMGMVVGQRMDTYTCSGCSGSGQIGANEVTCSECAGNGVK